MTAVRILRLAAGGDGVGTLEDGRTVFVPRTAPGDLVETRSLRLHKRFARARIGRLIEPAPDRVEPRCPHYVEDDCGGCQLQHLDGDAQRAARSGFVGDALRRLARLPAADPPLVPADRNWSYRTKLTLHVSADRRRIGLHPFDDASAVFDLRRCYITDDRLMALWQRLSGVRRLLPAGLARLVLRLDQEGRAHVVLRMHGGAEAWTHGSELGDALRRAGAEATIWLHPEGGAPRVVAGSSEAFPATVFEQVHPAMGALARSAALAALGDVAGLHLWDLYAGVGDTTDRLVAAGATVESVEADPRAVAEAERRSPTAAGGHVVRHAARAEDVSRKLRAPDAVVTNPPRIGMDQRVTDVLRHSGANRIAYISCDPATLARDLTRLQPEYRLASVEAFDLFPQTAHVETVALLVRAG